MKGMVFIDEIQESVNSSSWLLGEVGAGNGVVENTMCRSNGSKNSAEYILWRRSCFRKAILH